MRKKFFNLYEKICSPTNIWWAYKSAAKGKRYTPAVATFEYDVEKNLIEIEQDLRNESYELGGYHSFEIDKPKRRLVNAAPFRDRVLHHTLMNVIEPLFERQFIFDSYANRKGKGTHAALDRASYFMRRHKYTMHLDIKQFFPSVDHEILYSILSRIVGDEKVLNLIHKIISSGKEAQAEEYEMAYFPSDDIFAVNRPRGLPIGNLTSQHWANVYLNELDQFAKQRLKCRAYIRYVDDFVLFSNEKETLNYWRDEIINFLQSLRLTIHVSKAQANLTKWGIPFLGFTVFPSHRRLKHANGFAFQRRFKNQIQSLKHGNMNRKEFMNRLASWLNHASHGDTWNLRISILQKGKLYGGFYG